MCYAFYNPLAILLVPGRSVLIEEITAQYQYDDDIYTNDQEHDIIETVEEAVRDIPASFFEMIDIEGDNPKASHGNHPHEVLLMETKRLLGTEEVNAIDEGNDQQREQTDKHTDVVAVMRAVFKLLLHIIDFPLLLGVQQFFSGGIDEVYDDIIDRRKRQDQQEDEEVAGDDIEVVFEGKPALDEGEEDDQVPESESPGYFDTPAVYALDQ